MRNFEEEYNHALEEAVAKYNDPKTSIDTKKILQSLFKERLARTKNERMRDSLIAFLRDIISKNMLLTWDAEEKLKKEVEKYVKFLNHLDLTYSVDFEEDEEPIKLVEDLPLFSTSATVADKDSDHVYLTD